MMIQSGSGCLVLVDETFTQQKNIREQKQCWEDGRFFCSSSKNIAHAYIFYGARVSRRMRSRNDNLFGMDVGSDSLWIWLEYKLTTIQNVIGTILHPQIDIWVYCVVNLP
jgi:hypothetical protein